MMLVLTLVSGFAWPAKADFFSDAESDHIYKTYRQFCGGRRMVMMTDSLTGAVPVPPDVALSSTMEASSEFRFLVKSSALRRVLESPGYQRALSECFPGDELSQRHYTLALIQNDVMGKVAAGFGFVFAGKGLSRVLQRMGRAGTWIGRIGAGLFAIQISHTLIQAYIKFDQKLHPSRASHDEIKRLLALQLEQTEDDIKALESCLEQNPDDQDIKSLLKQAHKLRHEIRGSLSTIEP